MISSAHVSYTPDGISLEEINGGLKMAAIGEQIKKFRVRKGYTQEKLGSLIGVTTQAVSKWERGSVPDAELLPDIADALDIDVNSLFGREELDIQVFLTKKLSKLPQDEAFRCAFDVCWSVFFGLVGDEDFAEDFTDTFIGRSDIRREKSQDYFVKMIRERGMALARLSGNFSQFYLLAEHGGEGLRGSFDDIESIRKVFALFAEGHLLKTICYLYSKPCIPVTAELIAKGTGYGMREVERCMKIICDSQLAQRIKIAGVEGEIDAYSLRRESCIVPLLSFADEIAKGSPFPVFNMFDREKPLL